MRHWLFSALVLCLVALSAGAQTSPAAKVSTDDSLRGFLQASRTAFDVRRYELLFQPDFEKQSLQGSNLISFVARHRLDSLHLDLSPRMRIRSIRSGPGEAQLQYRRKGAALFVYLDETLQRGDTGQVRIDFGGKPLQAENPPWDGGLVWRKTPQGKHWLTAAVEGEGAHQWWPCKDHPADEAEEALISIRVPAESPQTPSELVAVANGRLLQKFTAPNPANPRQAFTTYRWKVSYPINDYNITLNIAPYVQIQDSLRYPSGQVLPISYYVLPQHEDTARQHFRQAKKMLQIYGQLFGPYPFLNDGYKLVETPYWGMEHQSCVAYGNHFRNNEFGFDFIIVHESGHEYWGNALSAADHGELWLHESLCTYTEALYLEKKADKATAQAYLDSQKTKIKNLEPILGPRNIHYHYWPDADMYYKGSWMLHTMRHVVSNDSLWFRALKGLYQTFRYRQVHTQQALDYLSRATGHSLGPLMLEYLQARQPPTLQYRIVGLFRKKLQFRWQSHRNDFQMPLLIRMDEQQQWIHPDQQWQEIPYEGAVEWPTSRFYFRPEEQ